jgi:hypothetical protein
MATTFDCISRGQGGHRAASARPALELNLFENWSAWNGSSHGKTPTGSRWRKRYKSENMDT